MEFLAYTSIIFLSYLFSLKRKLIKDSKIFFLVWFSAYFFLALIVRMNFDEDMIGYAESMKFTSYLPYYLKEPVVWIGQRLLFDFLKNSYLVFIIYDLLTGIFLYESLKKFNLPQYAYFSILVFFPFILGMQNIYRQWISSILFLYSFSFLWENMRSIKGYFLFIISFLSHNVSIIFFPLIFSKLNKITGVIIWISTLIVSFGNIYFGQSSKSSNPNTGFDLALLYIFILFLFIVIFVLLDKGVLKKIRSAEYKLFIGLFSLSLFSNFILTSNNTERISIFCLIVSYPFLVNLLEKKLRPNITIRISLTTFGFIPILLFPASKLFILN